MNVSGSTLAPLILGGPPAQFCSVNLAVTTLPGAVVATFFTENDTGTVARTVAGRIATNAIEIHRASFIYLSDYVDWVGLRENVWNVLRIGKFCSFFPQHFFPIGNEVVK